MSEISRIGVEFSDSASFPDGIDPEIKIKKKRGYLKYSPLSLVLLSVCAFVFAFSMFGLFEQVVLDGAGEAEVNTLSNLAFPNTGSSGDDLVPLPGGGANTKAWQSITPDLIDPTSLHFLQTVTFEGLLAQNPDTVSWMYWPTTVDVNGLPFNLPVVQTTDNEYYLNKGFDQSNSVNGWVYSDYRCNWNHLVQNRNTILYGHARSYLIFGGLRFLNGKTKWQQDGYNHFIYINTPNERTVWQIFSWYETTTDFNYIDTHFSSDEEYVAFLNTVQGNNTVPAFEKFEFTADDRILTLSTCKGVNSKDRVAVHAVLVKHEYINGEPEDDESDGFITGTLPDYGFNDPDESTDSDAAPDPSGSGSGSSSDSSDFVTDTGTPPLTGSGSQPSTDVQPPVTDTGTPPDSGSGSTSGGTTPPATDTGTPTDTPSGSGTPGDSGSSSTDTGTPSTDSGTPSVTDSSGSGGTDGGNPTPSDSGTPAA